MDDIIMLDYIVYIGRFQPFHAGHLEVVRHAQSLAKNVIIFIGSSNKSRTKENPFTYNERYRVISRALEDAHRADRDRVIITALPDNRDDEAWAERIITVVNYAAKGSDKIGIIGLNKGQEQQNVLPLLPDWQYIESNNLSSDIHASSIRKTYFQDGQVDSNLVPDATYNFLGTLSIELYRELASLHKRD